MASGTKQTKGKSTNKGTDTKTVKRIAKSKKGEIAIYGGKFTITLSERNYVIYRRLFLEPMSKYVAVDEDDPNFEQKIESLLTKSPNYYRENWIDIVSNFSNDLARARDRLLANFSLDRQYIYEIEYACEKAVDSLMDYGHQFAKSFDKLANDDSVSIEECQAGCTKGAIFFMMMFGEVLNSAVDTVFRDVLARAGIKLKEYGTIGDDKKARKLFQSLKNRELASGKKNDVKLTVLKLAPDEKDFVEWCWLDDAGKGPINEVAQILEVDVSQLSRKLLAKTAGKKDFSSEKAVNDYRKRLVKAAEELELDISEELLEIENALERLDREYRTVDGREFATRKEAEKQRELAEFERTLDLSNEDAALKAKSGLERLIKKLGIDGLWKMNRVAKALECFDKLAKRAGDRIFETREEAAKQRELVDFEKSGKITDEASALKLKSDIIALAKRLGIDGTWKLDRVNSELKRFDKLARTAFGMEYQTREEAAAKRDSTEAFLAAIETAITSSDDNGFYFKDRIPSKKLIGARTYLTGAQDDGVFAIVDTTIFGSAKIGLAVSRWGIVWKNDTVKTARNAYSWKELALLTSPSKPDRGEITFEKGVVFDFTNSNGNADACRDTLVKMVAFAKEATCLDRLSAVKTIGQSADTFDMSVFTKHPCDCLFVEGNIPEKKLHNAFVSMKVQEPIESVRLLIDSTVFGSAKEGLLATNDAIYSKNFMEDPIRVTFESVESVEAKKNAITINSKTCQLINMTTDVLEAVCGYIKAVSQAKGGK